MAGTLMWSRVPHDKIQEFIMKDTQFMQNEGSWIVYLRKSVPLINLRLFLQVFLQKRGFVVEETPEATCTKGSDSKGFHVEMNVIFNDQEQRVLQISFEGDKDSNFSNIFRKFCEDLGREIASRRFLRSQVLLPILNADMISIENKMMQGGIIPSSLEDQFLYVEKNSRDFQFSQFILVGIQKSINEWLVPSLESKSSREPLSSKHYESAPTANYIIGDTNFGFQIHAPVVFSKLRNLFGITEEQYLSSFSVEKGLFTRKTAGRSGSIFFYTHDMKFIVKTICNAETTVLKAILQDYCKHIEESEKTLLTVFCGFYTIYTSAFTSGTSFVVMQNIFPPEKNLLYTFDLKGSSIGRATNAKDRKEGIISLKDLEFIQFCKGISIPSGHRKEILETLEHDSQFLQRREITDYSLLLGISKSENTKEFFIGVVDILTQYDINKKLEKHLKSYWNAKSWIHPSPDQVQPLLSAMDPVAYRSRFLHFVGNVVFPDEEVVKTLDSQTQSEDGWVLL